MSVFVEASKHIPVIGEYDTVIVGGGFAGVSAALAAARGGNSVLLCEREYMLGGLGTAGLVTIYLPLCDGMGHQISFGIAEELLKLSISQGYEAEYPKAWLEGGTFEEKCEKRYQVRYNAGMCAILYEKKLLDEGVKILYGTVVCNAAVENHEITHLIIENKSGRSAVKAGNVIDCSGDADVCKFAGDDTALFGRSNNLAGWYYYCDDGNFGLQMLGGSHKRKDGLETEEKHYGGVDGWNVSEQVVDAHDMTYHHFLERGQLSDRHMLATIASIPQIRMSRRLDTPFKLDVSHERLYFEDSIGAFAHWYKRGPVFEMPYRVLHSAKIKNLAAAGRCISVTDEMWDLTRVIPVCAVTGEAVGTAAAIAKNFDEVPLETLQQTLQDNGVKLHLHEIFS